LNATLFRPGQMGGMETYFRNLLYSLQEVDDKNSYALLCDRHYVNELPLSNKNFKETLYNFTKPSFRWLLRGIIRNITKIDILQSAMNSLDVDVIHHPFSILNPLDLTIPSVLTFHDMQHEFFPDYFSTYEMKIRKEFYSPSAKQATRIIAISNYSKSCLVKMYNIAPEKIDVIYHGYNSRFRIIEDSSRLEQIRLRYGIRKPFLYYPAATWPHKNHIMLLAALKMLKDKYAFEGQLVLSGMTRKTNSELKKKIDQLGVVDSVKILGYLPYEDLPYLYNLARMLVFPSLFEGFGLPLVEAMACGCPIACSNTTSIPEVIDDAGVFFDPTSAEDIAEKVSMLWNSEEERKTLIGKGLERVKSKAFSWENNARKTIKVYKKAVEEL